MSALPTVDVILVTAEGYDRACAELETLRTEGRRMVSEQLREARADGHPDDNPGLFDVLEEQAQLERRIASLEVRLAAARVAEPNGDGGAGIGSSILLRDLETSELVEYELVGAIEADLDQGRRFGRRTGWTRASRCRRRSNRRGCLSARRAALPGDQRRRRRAFGEESRVSPASVRFVR